MFNPRQLFHIPSISMPNRKNESNETLTLATINKFGKVNDIEKTCAFAHATHHKIIVPEKPLIIHESKRMYAQLHT